MGLSNEIVGGFIGRILFLIISNIMTSLLQGLTF
ncbi:hypothetical protein MCO_00164 [Bartonella sp. DB5-6]|nr:hypothetical protein MCO_00164 [Bartonella sp. DB5-6]